MSSSICTSHSLQQLSGQAEAIQLVYGWIWYGQRYDSHLGDLYHPAACHSVCDVEEKVCLIRLHAGSGGCVESEHRESAKADSFLVLEDLIRINGGLKNGEEGRID